MPIYEYTCQCGGNKEIKLSYKDSDKTQVCKCGGIMTKKISLLNFTIKPTGKGMALDTLNSNVVGGKRKAFVESMAVKGI